MTNKKVTNTSLGKIVSSMMVLFLIFIFSNCSEDSVSPVIDPNELEYVIPEDVRAIAHDVMRHRIGLTYEAEAENITSEDIINEILNTVEVP